MSLSNIHKQDLLSLARVFNQPSELVIELGEKYGYQVGYRYLDLCISNNKPIKSTIKSKTYKLLTRIINPLKRIK